MVYSKTTLDTDAMRRQLDIYERSPELLSEVSLQVLSENEAALLADLSAIPPKPDRPLEFVSPKQKRTVIMILKRQFYERNNRWPGPDDDWSYVRTGKPPMGWQVDIEAPQNITRLIIANTWNKARFVFGALTGIRSDRKSYTATDQQPFHETTGWPYVPPIITDWFDRINTQIEKRYRERLRDERTKR